MLLNTSQLLQYELSDSASQAGKCKHSSLHIQCFSLTCNTKQFISPAPTHGQILVWIVSPSGILLKAVRQWCTRWRRRSWSVVHRPGWAPQHSWPVCPSPPTESPGQRSTSVLGQLSLSGTESCGACAQYLRVIKPHREMNWINEVTPNCARSLVVAYLQATYHFASWRADLVSHYLIRTS